MKVSTLTFIILFVCVSACSAEYNELELPSIDAFSIGTDINIKSVKEIETDSLNTVLEEAQQKDEEWTKSFIQIALHLSGATLSGASQSVSVRIVPTEWEEGRKLDWVRITIIDEGWLDDSVAGERFVVWLVQDTDGSLKLERILWAHLCRRQYWKFYSSEPCP